MFSFTYLKIWPFGDILGGELGKWTLYVVDEKESSIGDYRSTDLLMTLVISQMVYGLSDLIW